jgi:NADPH:quinone reductase-like Zn-dependent oxidoreductase
MSPSTLPAQQSAIHLPAFVSSISALSVSAIPLPAPTANSVVIKVTHVSPTHVDLLYAQGLHQNNRRHAKPPFTLGMDFAGTILSPGSSNWRKGDKVYGSHFGVFAEYIVLDLEKGQGGGIRKVPRSWNSREACAVGASGATSLGCFLRAGGIKKGEWVLVTGATGGLGVLAVQIARALGGRVIALVGKDESKASMLKSLGVEEFIRYDEEGWEENVKRATGGEGVNLVYDAVGMVESSLKCCAYGGRVVIVGFAGRHGDIEKVRANRMLLKSAAVMGYRFGEHGRRHPKEVEGIWKAFDDMVEKGEIKAVVYDEVYKGLSDIPRAMKDLEERRVWGRAVIEVGDKGDQKARL